MEIEDTGTLRRLVRPLLVALLIAAAVAIPAWLWFTRGRKLPLSVVLDPPRYVVAAGTQVALRPRIRPTGADLQVEWVGAGMEAGAGGEARWRAPREPGIYTVGVRVVRAGSVAEDTVSFRVLARPVEALPLERPPEPPSLPRTLPACDGRAPRVEIHGRPCSGATIVAELVSSSSLQVFHWWASAAAAPHAGRLANLRIERGARGELQLFTRAVDSGRGCAVTRTTAVRVAPCVAGPAAGPVFADFSWQMVGAAHFRFAAKPARQAGVTFTEYRWSFGDGEEKVGRQPLVAHRFKGPPRRWHLVQLTVTARTGAAAGELRESAVRAVMDRSVAAP